jgi:hypothetical protein
MRTKVLLLDETKSSKSELEIALMNDPDLELIILGGIPQISVIHPEDEAENDE